MYKKFIFLVTVQLLMNYDTKKKVAAFYLEGVEHAEHQPLLLAVIRGVLQSVLRPVPLPVI